MKPRKGTILNQQSGPKKSHNDLHGIIVPMVTPFKGKNMEEIDHAALSKLTSYLSDNQVNALMVNGTSGEFLMQSHEERKEAVRTVSRAAHGRVPVIAGISEASTKNAIELGQSAEEAGVDAVIATGPMYYKTTEDGLFNHFSAIIENVKLPLMIYNIPSWIGYGVQPEIVKKLATRHPGKVFGVKFTTSDLEQFLGYLRILKGVVPVTIGSDPLILSALELGASGATVGCANVLPEETCRIYEFFKDGNFEQARKAQEKIDGFTEILGLGTFPAALKEALRFIGLDCGDVRPPLVPLDSKQAKTVRRSLMWKKKLNSNTNDRSE